MDKSVESKEEKVDPRSLYIYAMKAPMTTDRYQTRLANFFDFIGLEIGVKLEDRARAFAQRGKDDGNWALNNIVCRVEQQMNLRKEASPAVEAINDILNPSERIEKHLTEIELKSSSRRNKEALCK